MLEIEAKFKLKSRQQLLDIGAMFISKKYVKDLYFDDEEKNFEKKDLVLRLRNKNDKYYLAYKGPRQNNKENKNLQVREEIELEVSNNINTKFILESLGYKVSDVVEKTRELFKLKNYSVKFEVDNYPFVGLFLEIEGDKSEIFEVMKLLGFTMNDAIKKHNGEIFDDYVKKNSNLKFENHKLQFTFEDQELILHPEVIILVDDKDNFIGKELRKVDGKKGRFRVSALWITNSKGDILLAKRAYWKKINPGKWGPAAAGVNAFGETYESNIIKESKEEIGIDLIDFKKGPKLNKGDHFTQFFFALIDEDISFFKPNHEVDELKWFSKKELKEKLDQYPEMFLKSTKKYFEMFTQ